MAPMGMPKKPPAPSKNQKLLALGQTRKLGLVFQGLPIGNCPHRQDGRKQRVLRVGRASYP